MARRIRWSKRLWISAVSAIVCVGLVYFGSVAYRARALYDIVKMRRGWTGRLFRADAQLGYSGVPGACGVQLVGMPPDVPTCFDADGFRVPDPAQAVLSNERPLVLALGCSYSFGFACRAEESFPERVAQRLHGTCRNAAMPGFGLAQMLILARKHIPRLKPDIVLVQYSGWLVYRSREDHIAGLPGTLPAPQFVTSATGMALALPSFEFVANPFDLPVAEYLETPASWFDFASFVARVELPSQSRLDWRATRVWIHGLVEHAAEPADEQEIERSVYSEIASLCAQNGAHMVVVALWKNMPAEGPVVPAAVTELGCPVVIPLPALRANLAEKTREGYMREYMHWRGDPPVLVDGHPNARAHAIIADEIMRELEGRN